MQMTDQRLLIVNQMILACIFGIGVIGVLFALLFFKTEISTPVLTLVTTLLTLLGSVVLMQNTHFFKPGNAPDTTPTGVITNANIVKADPVPPNSPVV